MNNTTNNILLLHVGQVKALCVFVILVCWMAGLPAQDLAHYKDIVKELSSAKYQGRGYAKDGVVKAGKYIADEFRRSGADEVTLQPFTINVNTFPGNMAMSVDGKKLRPGTDFVMREYSPGAHGTFPLFYVDTLHYDSKCLFEELAKPEHKDAFVVCDFWFTYRHGADFKRLQSKDGCRNGGLVYTWDTPLKFYKAYADRVVDKPIVWVSADFPKDAKSISLDIDHEFLENYESSNVIAKVSGERHDSCYVFTAHYDHLGNLGRNLYFPGANDNASGTAAIITLAEHYARHKPLFDIYFMAFAGEDSGLNGSNFFVNHPLFPLRSIRYLFNLDMIGDNNPVQYCEFSDAGLTGFALMQQLNQNHHYFKAFSRGMLAANSDHYPFAEREVPCVMFENEQGDAFIHYHTANDNWKNAIFTTYEPIFKLVTDYVRLTTTPGVGF